MRDVIFIEENIYGTLGGSPPANSIQLPETDNAKTYKDLRNMLTNPDYKDFRVPQLAKGIVNILGSSYKDVIMDEDAVIVTSNPWGNLHFHPSDDFREVKHALPHCRDNTAIQKEFPMRLIKFHSFTGHPSFKEHRDDVEVNVIGRCSCGVPTNVFGVSMPKDPLHDAYDSKGHYTRLKEMSEAYKTDKSNNKTKKIQQMKDKNKVVLEVLSKEPYDRYKMNEKLICEAVLRYLHEEARLKFEEFKTNKDLRHIQETCDERIEFILRHFCTVKWTAVDGTESNLEWQQLHKQDHEGDNDKLWRDKEGEVIAQVSTYGAYIRLYYVMLCACKLDLKKHVDLNESKPKQKALPQGNELAGFSARTKAFQMNPEEEERRRSKQSARDKEIARDNEIARLSLAEEPASAQKLKKGKSKKPKQPKQTTSKDDDEYLVPETLTDEAKKTFLNTLRSANLENLVTNFSNNTVIHNKLQGKVVHEIQDRVMDFEDKPDTLEWKTQETVNTLAKALQKTLQTIDFDGKIRDAEGKIDVNNDDASDMLNVLHSCVKTLPTSCITPEWVEHIIRKSGENQDDRLSYRGFEADVWICIVDDIYKFGPTSSPKEVSSELITRLAGDLSKFRNFDLNNPLGSDVTRREINNFLIHLIGIGKYIDGTRLNEFVKLMHDKHDLWTFLFTFTSVKYMNEELGSLLKKWLETMRIFRLCMEFRTDENDAHKTTMCKQFIKYAITVLELKPDWERKYYYELEEKTIELLNLFMFEMDKNVWSEPDFVETSIKSIYKTLDNSRLLHAHPEDQERSFPPFVNFVLKHSSTNQLPEEFREKLTTYITDYFPDQYLSLIRQGLRSPEIRQGLRSLESRRPPLSRRRQPRSLFESVDE